MDRLIWVKANWNWLADSQPFISLVRAGVPLLVSLHAVGGAIGAADERLIGEA